MEPGEENHVQIPEPQARAGCSGNAQNAALTYSGLVGISSEGRKSVPVFKGLEFSPNARVQDESSASELPSASQGAGQSFGVSLCHPVPCRTLLPLPCPARLWAIAHVAFPKVLSVGCTQGWVNFWVRFALLGHAGTLTLTPLCHFQQDRKSHKPDKLLCFQSHPCRGMCRGVDAPGVLRGWEGIKY